MDIIYTSVGHFIKMLKDVGIDDSTMNYRNKDAVCRQREGYMAQETRCSMKQRLRIMASNNNNMHNPMIKTCRECLLMLLLLHAIILCLCFILHLVCHAIYISLSLHTAPLFLSLSSLHPSTF